MKPIVRPLVGLVTVCAVTAATLAPAAADPTGPAPVRTSTTGAQEPAVPRAADVSGAQGLGRWSITPQAAGSWRVTWVGPTALPLTADRPVVTGPDGQRLATTVSAGGRSVSALVQSRNTPDPDDFDVHLSGRVLDARPGTSVDPGTARAPLPPKMAAGKRLLPQDPAKAGPYATVTSNYTRPAVKVPGYQQPIEMVGHVVAPAPGENTGPRPLVLFMHGRHQYCYGKGNDGSWPCKRPMKEIPSHLGYDYLQQRLASQGFTTVSIRVNGINAQDEVDMDGGAAARATIVRKHLDHWVTRAAAEKVDLSRVILVGHSRGGEGVNRASLTIPLSAPYRVVGQVLLAPTDFASQTTPHVPTVTVLPSCDGDVSDLQGQKFTDMSRDLGLGDTSLKSSVMVVGANHNFYNTEWTPATATAPADDDWWGPAGAACGRKDPNRLSAAQQRATGLATVTGAARLFAFNQDEYLPLFDGSDVRVATTGRAALRSHALGGGRTVLRPGRELGATASGGGTVALCRGSIKLSSKPGLNGLCGPAFTGTAPHWSDPQNRDPQPRRGFRIDWAKAGARVQFPLGSPMDLSHDDLSMRVVVDQRVARVGLKVAVVDGTGAAAVLTPTAGGTLERFPGGVRGGKWWGQTVTVRAAGATGVNLADIRAVRLLPTTGKGSLIVLDAARVPQDLPALAAKRAVLMQVGLGKQTEGNGRGAATGHVPAHLSGPAPAGSSVRMLVTDYSTGRTTGRSIPVPTGATSINLPVAYRQDRAWGGRSVQHEVTVLPERGLMTDDYLGSLAVLEDDPRPKVTITPVKRTVREGESFKVRVRFSRPFTQATSAWGEFVKSQGRPLRPSDFNPKTFSWFEKGDKPMARSGASVERTMRPGKLGTVITMKVRKDGQREGLETMRMRVTVFDHGNRMGSKVMVLKVRD